LFLCVDVLNALITWVAIDALPSIDTYDSKPLAGLLMANATARWTECRLFGWRVEPFSFGLFIHSIIHGYKFHFKISYMQNK